MATPKNFGYNMSIMILVFVVLGGIGNIRGSIISAVVLTLLPELLRGLSNFRVLIYASVLIAMMLFSWSPKAQDFRDKVVSSVFFWRNKENDMKGGIDNAGN
jgi:branched-chain amino acid transport system permease protein